MAVQAQFVHCGDAIDYTPGADVAAGTVVVLGDLVGFTKVDIKANQLDALAVRGVADFANAAGAGVAFALGAKVYWDDTNNVAVTADGGGTHKLLGKAVLAAADADATVRVRLSQ